VLLVISIKNENTEEWFYLKMFYDEWEMKRDIMKMDSSKSG
jgi:hypothetical protein